MRLGLSSLRKNKKSCRDSPSNTRRRQLPQILEVDSIARTVKFELRELFFYECSWNSDIVGACRLIQIWGPCPQETHPGRISPTGGCQRLFASTTYAVADRFHNIRKPPSSAREIVDTAADF